MLAEFDHTFGLLDHHFGDLNVAAGRLVKSTRHDFAMGPLHLTFHVGHFFGPLVNEQHDDIDIGMVDEDRLGHLLQQDRLPRLGWRNNESPLAESDRRDHVDDPSTQLGGIGRQTDPLRGM